MSVDRNIKEIRNRKGITQEQLANKIGVAQSLVAQYERGSKVPNLLTAKEMAKALECDINDFLKEV